MRGNLGLSTAEPERKACMNCGAMINSRSIMCPICGTGEPFVPRLNIQRRQNLARWWLYGALGLIGLRLLGGAALLLRTDYISGILTLLVDGSAFYGLYKEKKWGYYLAVIWNGLDLALSLFIAFSSSLSTLIEGFGAIIFDVILIALVVYGYIKVFRAENVTSTPPQPPPMIS